MNGDNHEAITGWWFVGVDLEQSRDYTALAVLERVPLGTPYPEIVERVRRTVVDLLRVAGLGATMLPAIITGGAAESLNNGYYSVPKRDLIAGLQVLLQCGGLQIAAGLKYGPDLVTELTGMRVRVGGEGREQYGAWREGTHDD